MRIRVWVRTLVVSMALAILKLPLSGQTSLGPKAPSSAQQDWTNYVRIGGYGLAADNADQNRSQRRGGRCRLVSRLITT